MGRHCTAALAAGEKLRTFGVASSRTCSGQAKCGQAFLGRLRGGETLRLTGQSTLLAQECCTITTLGLVPSRLGSK